MATLNILYKIQLLYNFSYVPMHVSKSYLRQKNDRQKDGKRAGVFQGQFSAPLSFNGRVAANVTNREFQKKFQTKGSHH